ncbi:alpha/beta family hydrolase [Tessaracoccus lubricantis]|uniref:alpha/beta hydrolase family protein n=1 Tax=Tessaracoccus lubricantis TaxID=545543 RepID=UPI0031EFC7C8
MPTSKGMARVHVQLDEASAGLLVLGHGAGGGVDSPDLRAARDAGLDSGMAVALVEQPYRVAGRRVPPPIAAAAQAWVEVVQHLRERFADGVLVAGGRSFGGRVACRSAVEVGADAVLCLAFPLVSPKGADRGPELYGVRLPVLVVQGERDPFGLPEEGEGRTVVVVQGTHTLNKDGDRISRVVSEWLRECL